VVVEPFFNIAEVVLVQTVPLYLKPNRRVKEGGKIDPLCLLRIKMNQQFFGDGLSREIRTYLEKRSQAVYSQNPDSAS